MPFGVPNLASATYPGQAALDSGDIAILSAGFAQTGVISGCAVTPQGSPNMTVAVASGVVSVSGSSVTASSNASLSIGAADSTNGRYDLVYISSGGTPTVAAGTASSNPVYPTVPSTGAVLAAIYIQAGASSIAAGNIIDKRVTLINATSLTNPMSAVGQMIRGGTSGTPTFIAAPTAGQYLGASGSPAIPVWTAGPGASVLNKFIAANDATTAEKAVAQVQCGSSANQADINTALSTGAVNIVLSSGTFNFSGSVNVPTNSRIHGQGAGITTINASAGVDCFQFANGVSGFTIGDFSIGSGQHGMSCLTGEIYRFLIHDVYFGAVTGCGFQANAVERANFERVEFNHCGDDGIFIANGSQLNNRAERIFISNAIFDSVGGNGMHFGVPSGSTANNTTDVGDGVILNPVFLGVGKHGLLVYQCRFLQVINLNSENCSQASDGTYDVVHIGPTNYQGFQLRGGIAKSSSAFPFHHRYGIYTEAPNSLLENVDADGTLAGFSLQGAPLIAQDISGTFTALDHNGYPGAHQFINSRYATPIADGHTYETTYRGLIGAGMTMWLMDSNGVGTGSVGAFRVRNGATAGEVFRVDPDGQVHIKPQTGTASSITVHADL